MDDTAATASDPRPRAPAAPAPLRPEEAIRQRLGRRAIVLVGLMGAGKSTVGRRLASRLQLPFRDADHEIQEAANMTIADIFAVHGEPYFRSGEQRVIARLLGDGPLVLATGGGAYMQERNRRAVSAAGGAMWLDADLDLLWERVRHKDGRPLLRTPDPRGTLAELFAKRVPVYRLAELSVRTLPSYSIEDTAARVVEALAAQPDVLGPVGRGR